MLNAVNGLNAFQHILNGIVDRILTGFQSQPLVAHILQSRNLPHDLLLSQLFPGDVLVFQMVGAVQTAVDAVVGQVEGCKHHDTAAVKFPLDFPGQFKNLLISLLILTG